MNKYLVSIVTPVYNSERFISETIESIQSQTYRNWELLLIDDEDTLLLNDEFLKGLDEELDAFLKDLLEK